MEVGVSAYRFSGFGKAKKVEHDGKLEGVWTYVYCYYKDGVVKGAVRVTDEPKVVEMVVDTFAETKLKFVLGDTFNG